MAQQITQADFRAALGRFATGVTVVTTRAGETLHGMTASAFSSLSLDPPLVLVCVSRSSVMHEMLSRSQAFAASMLSAEQRELSVWFSSPGRPRGDGQFAEVPCEPSPVTGCPLISDSVAFVDCEVRAVHDGGDHGIFVGEVVATGVRPELEPLVYYGSAYRRLAP